MPFGLILCVGADVSPYQLSLQMLVCGLAIIVLDWYQQERRPRRLPRAHPAQDPAHPDLYLSSTHTETALGGLGTYGSANGSK